MLMAGAGILAGVAVTKLIPKYIPASITSTLGSSSIMGVAISGIAAWATGYLLGRVDPTFGRYAMYGGVAQTISVALSAFLPSVSGPFSLGDLMNGNYVVPQNPIRAGMAYPVAAGPAARGMAAYPSAY